MVGTLLGKPGKGAASPSFQYIKKKLVLVRVTCTQSKNSNNAEKSIRERETQPPACPRGHATRLGRPPSHVTATCRDARPTQAGSPQRSFPMSSDQSTCTDKSLRSAAVWHHCYLSNVCTESASRCRGLLLAAVGAAMNMWGTRPFVFGLLSLAVFL